MNMNKKCNCNSTVNKYVDVTKLPIEAWEDAISLLAMDECGLVMNIEKPNYTDKGEGNKALFDDGEYKEILTKDEIEDLDEVNKEALDKTIKEIKESIKENETNLNLHTKDQDIINTDIENRVTKNSKDVEDLKQKDLDLVKEIGVNTNNIKANKDQIEINANKIKDLNTKVDTNKTEVKESINDLKETISTHITAVNTKVDTAVTKLELKDERLSDRIDKEVKERIEADAIHTADIKVLDGTVKTFEDKLKSNIDNVNTNVNEINNKLTSRINDEINNRETVIKRVDTDIDRVEDDIKDIKSNYLKIESANGKFASKDELKESNNNIAENKANIEINKDDIETLKSAGLYRTHFRGYLQTNAEIKAIDNSEKRDYAYSAESGTKWIFRDNWIDSGVAVPDKVTPASVLVPLVAGEASNGTEEAYARGDHRHPSDPSKANVVDVYTKTEVDLKVREGVDKIDLTPYAKKDYVDTKFTKVETDLNLKASKEYVDTKDEAINTEVLKKANKTYVDDLNKGVNEKLATKLEAKDIVNKADKSYVNGEINKVNTAIDLKADKTYVDTEKKKLEDRIAELEAIIKEIGYWQK